MKFNLNQDLTKPPPRETKLRGGLRISPCITTGPIPNRNVWCHNTRQEYNGRSSLQLALTAHGTYTVMFRPATGTAAVREPDETCASASSR